MTAKVEIPLGKLEDQHLEFKSAAVLEQPEKIAREVVAMLNADGGEVWIGVREKDGRAMEIEPIPDAESARSRLVDFLIDTLNPSPKGDELSIEVVPLGSDQHAAEKLLRIKLTSTPARKPFGVVRGTSWTFPRRVGARLIPMTREELREAMSTGASALEELEDGRRRLLAWRDEERQTGLKGLWLGLLTVPDLPLDPQAELFEKLATDPTESGNRRSGSTFVFAGYRAAVTADHVYWGDVHHDEPGLERFELRVRVYDDGRANFFSSYGGLTGGLARRNDKIQHTALLELPTSALRVMSRVYGNLGTGHFRLLADLALFELNVETFVPIPEPQRIDVLSDKPLEFTQQEIVEEPDRCAFRLVRRIYQAFGRREDQMPGGFDRDSGRLVLPE
jgi:hypothetical protein